MSYSLGHPVRLVGGRLVLDFVNTADWNEDGSIAHEKLMNADDLALWIEATETKAVNQRDVAKLIEFRAELREVLLARKPHKPVSRFDMVKGDGRVDLSEPMSLETLLVASMLSVFCDPRELSRMKMCPGKGCGWLFIDESKNSRRTWCSMESCGNRAKAARHYQRTKQRAR